ncbi:MAG TPA: hypothetical protein VKE70_30960, partial [Candidatus Solibacter sp.]|nr:hypothetical protein [Candidatus Solibacter sp.]
NTAGLKNAILSNVDVVASLQGITITGGRLNVNRAIRSCATTTVSGAAAFVKTDTATMGNWKSAYGVEGSTVINDSASNPAYVAPAVSGNSNYTWAASTTDSRGLQKAAASDRIAACWYSTGSFIIDFNLADSNTHQVALYMVDWDNWGGGRTQRVDIFDSNGNLLDSRNVSGFGNGQYLVWNFSGHVMARFTSTNVNSNAVVSGIFFGGAGSTSTPTGTAGFVKTDTTTLGAWKSAYGGQGFNVINDTTAYPSYVTVTASGNSNYTWAASTADTRGLQKNATADRIAACWFSGTNFTLDLAFSDTAAHQVAFYMLDWDNMGGGRTQRVDILDSNGALLDSRNVSAFGSGQYLVWNFTGRVLARFTTTNPNGNAVVSGIFFGGASTSNPTGTAAFIKTDTTTAGTWKGAYGGEGFNVINDTTVYPSYASVNASGNSNYTWSASTTDTRGLQKNATSDRIAACWFSGTTFTVDLAFSDTATHQVAFYMLDWDNMGGGRAQRVDILDSNGVLLDSRNVSAFGNGQYLVWNFTGHVLARFTTTNPNGNAVVSGIFFGAGATTPATAAFVKSDTATSGTWKGVYGSAGYTLIGDAASMPAYAVATPSGNQSFTWAASTTDARGPQKAAASDRIAACWYSFSNFTVDLAFSDTATHQVALYMVDWDIWGGGRTQRIDILDTNGNVLDSRSISNFVNGQYLVWNVSGHVVARFTSTNANSNAVLSGIFFQ